jgi:pimeloyl-ACP methyl ester carboxylesterase
LVAVLVMAIVVGASAASARAAAGGSTTSAESTTFAKRVNIGGGRSMYIECRGKGSPTVLLLSGALSASDAWHAADQRGPKVYPSVARYTRVCAYDRPGVVRRDGELSRSDPAPQPTNARIAADDLDALLQAADVPGPYVLVPHSFSGTVARVFAAEHPDQVKGIVFVDVLTPEVRRLMTADEWAQVAVGNAPSAEALAEYPAREQADFPTSLDQVEASAALGPMPVVVLTSSKSWHDLYADAFDKGQSPPGVSRDFGAVVDKNAPIAHAQLAALFPGSEHITDTKAGHDIMIDNAPLVIRSIREVVAAVRDGRSRLHP